MKLRMVCNLSVPAALGVAVMLATCETPDGVRRRRLQPASPAAATSPLPSWATIGVPALHANAALRSGLAPLLTPSVQRELGLSPSTCARVKDVSRSLQRDAEATAAGLAAEIRRLQEQGRTRELEEAHRRARQLLQDVTDRYVVAVDELLAGER